MTKFLTGEQIALARRALSMTQEELARASGVHRTTVAKVEKSPPPLPPRVIRMLSRYLLGREGITLDGRVMKVRVDK